MAFHLVFDLRLNFRIQLSHLVEHGDEETTGIGIIFQGDERALAACDQVVELPEMNLLCAPLAQMIMAQMFAYYTALDLGRNIDKPRNLAKSVTVG